MFESWLAAVNRLPLRLEPITAMRRMIQRQYDADNLSFAEAVALLDILQHRVDTATIPVSIPA